MNTPAITLVSLNGTIGLTDEVSPRAIEAISTPEARYSQLLRSVHPHLFSSPAPTYPNSLGR